MTPKTQATNTKIGQLDHLKLKNTYVSKDTNNEVKKQPAEQEIIFLNHISDKELVSRREPLQLNSKAPTTQQQQAINSTKKMSERHKKRHFPKEDIQMADKYMKRCSKTLIIGEMQIKTTKKYRPTSIRMATLV